MVKKPETTEPKRGRPATGKTPKLDVRVSDEERELWQSAADASGAANLSAWLREVATRAARRALRK